jgi:hypothetical protein
MLDRHGRGACSFASFGGPCSNPAFLPRPERGNGLAADKRQCNKAAVQATILTLKDSLKKLTVMGNCASYAGLQRASNGSVDLAPFAVAAVR